MVFPSLCCYSRTSSIIAVIPTLAVLVPRRHDLLIPPFAFDCAARSIEVTHLRGQQGNAASHGEGTHPVRYRKPIVALDDFHRIDHVAILFWLPGPLRNSLRIDSRGIAPTAFPICALDLQCHFVEIVVLLKAADDEPLQRCRWLLAWRRMSDGQMNVMGSATTVNP